MLDSSKSSEVNCSTVTCQVDVSSILDSSQVLDSTQSAKVLHSSNMSKSYVPVIASFFKIFESSKTIQLMNSSATDVPESSEVSNSIDSANSE